MKKFKPVLDSLILEVRYDFGNLYFDRCGLCLNDIEESRPNWHAVVASNNTGQLEDPENNLIVSFNNRSYNFTANKIENTGTNLAVIIGEATHLWKTIQANLGLDEFSRIGCRVHYILATDSIEQAEKLILKSDFKIDFKGIFKGYEVRTFNITSMLRKAPVEYRIELSSVIRGESINPEKIIKGDIRYLSKQQKQLYISQQKQISAYNANPMYAIMLDVDCFQVYPENISIPDFINNQDEIIRKDFLPILDNLCKI